MFLSEVFDYLTYGELAGLAIGGIGAAGIQEADQPRIINNINQALIELYTVLPLRTAQVNLQLYEHIGTYFLHTDYAQTNIGSTQPYKYINDSTANPFANDVLVVDQVFSEVGDEYPLNEPLEEYSVFTPTYNTIQIPFSKDDNTVDIIYRASPVLIDTTNVVPATTDVPIPYQALSAFLAYTLHKIHSSIGSGETSQAGMYYNKYKEALAAIKFNGLLITENSLNRRLDDNGWV